MKNKIMVARSEAGISQLLTLLAIVVLSAPIALAFPPDPFHFIYGTARDKYGTPLTSSSASVVFLASNGVAISAPIVPGLSPGMNFQMRVPIDSGQAPDLYEANAQLMLTPFTMLVVIGNTTNTAIEMAAGTHLLGQSAQAERIDLTLGVDSNNDGIPDAWENAFLATIGANIPLSLISSNSILTPDGLTLRQEYLLGTYPFDPDEPCLITFVGFQTGTPVLEFPTITGRYYTLLVSPDLKNWMPATFSLLPTGSGNAVVGGSTYNYVYASGIGDVQINLTAAGQSGLKAQFYRLQVQ